MGFKSPFLYHHLSIAPSRALLRHSLFFHNRRVLHFAPLLCKQNVVVQMVLGERPSTDIFEPAEILPASDPPHAPSPAKLAVSVVSSVELGAERRKFEKESKRKKERMAYLFAAVASTVGITFLTAGAVYYRFAWQTQGSEVPLSEMFGTFSLAVGASVGMEFWARWAHRALWHDSLWSMHESHHRPRDGPFELNDVFAIINAVPAISLMAFGFFHKGLVPGLCFGAGLGITIFGIAYMFVHDGLVHRRFPVGPIADVPYLQKVAAAHQVISSNLISSGIESFYNFIMQTSSMVYLMDFSLDPRKWYHNLEELRSLKR